MGNMGGGMSMSRNRSHNETSQTYNPDLEYSQQGYANALYGPNSPIGSWGMTGGQFPTVGKDRPGYGSNMYDNPWDYHSRPGGDSGSALANANYYKSGGGAPGELPPGGGTGIYPSGGGAYGRGGYAGGGYQFGQGGGGYGYGGYSAMAPYQFGSAGAQGDLNATGGAAYGGYSNLAGQYGQLGQQGVTPQERANLMAASNEAIQANAKSYRDQMLNRAAASGNTAGLYGGMARLGASSGQQLVGADRANQLAILQENQRRKEAGLAGQMGAAQGQAGLYGTGAGYMSNLLAGRGRLASLTNRTRQEGTSTGGQGGINYGG